MKEAVIEMEIAAPPFVSTFFPFVVVVVVGGAGGCSGIIDAGVDGIVPVDNFSHPDPVPWS